MIQVTPQMRILVATEPADFHKGIDGLCRQYDGSLFRSLGIVRLLQPYKTVHTVL